METRMIQAWVFMRSGARTAHFGEVRYRCEGDTPMDDHTFFEPGWKRCPALDTVVEAFDEKSLTLTMPDSRLVCACHPSDKPYLWET